MNMNYSETTVKLILKVCSYNSKECKSGRTNCETVIGLHSNLYFVFVNNTKSCLSLHALGLKKLKKSNLPLLETLLFFPRGLNPFLSIKLLLKLYPRPALDPVSRLCCYVSPVGIYSTFSFLCLTNVLLFLKTVSCMFSLIYSIYYSFKPQPTLIIIDYHDGIDQDEHICNVQVWEVIMVNVHSRG